MSEYRPIVDWAFWDSVDLFTTHEIVWLWCGIDPPDDDKRPPAMGARISKALRNELDSKQPEILPKEAVSGEQWYWKYTRHDLRAWAERHEYQPLFLFPELRPEKQSGLSLEGALAVIDALARLAYPKWDSGQRAYGLTPKIEKAGCNLDRKQIGNYLNEARKIKKIG